MTNIRASEFRRRIADRAAHATKSALILNFTGNSYHWGCFGTSYEIYWTLIERGYLPFYLSVGAADEIYPRATSEDDLLNPSFAEQVLQNNHILRTAFADSDLVVINGEGTLHGGGKRAHNLLYLGHLAKNVLRRPVHLINHSFYPNDNNCDIESIIGKYYKTAVQGFDSIVPRETTSHGIQLRLGIPSRLGFDNLPRFIERQVEGEELCARDRPRRISSLLLSGGVNMPERVAWRIAKCIRSIVHEDQRVNFLAGAPKYPASEDLAIFGVMRSEIKNLRLVAPCTFQEWIRAIADADCLISGRFHYAIAAAVLGTPVVTFPSNTPKIEAVAQMLNLETPINTDGPELESNLCRIIDIAIEKRSDTDTARRRDRMLMLSNQNFESIV